MILSYTVRYSLRHGSMDQKVIGLTARESLFSERNFGWKAKLLAWKKNKISENVLFWWSINESHDLEWLMTSIIDCIRSTQIPSDGDILIFAIGWQWHNAIESSVTFPRMTFVHLQRAPSHSVISLILSLKVFIILHSTYSTLRTEVSYYVIYACILLTLLVQLMYKDICSYVKSVLNK